MGVTGNPDELRRSGEMFVDLPRREPPLAPTPLFGGDGPLSAGLATAQNQIAYTAADFARTKDDGTVAAGQGLLEIAKNVTEFDRQGAEAIERLLPEPARDDRAQDSAAQDTAAQDTGTQDPGAPAPGVQEPAAQDPAAGNTGGGL
jgi:hypothetical protein